MFQELKEEIQHGFTWAIQSLYREEKGESDGNLLTAEKQGDDRGSIGVNFRGKDPEDTKTEFHPERKNGAWSLRYSQGNQDYYLFVVGDKVELRTLSQSENKELFDITNVSPTYKTIQSCRTKMFLQSDEVGNASMKTVQDLKGGKSQDRKTWFKILEVEDYEADFSASFCTSSQDQVVPDLN